MEHFQGKSLDSIRTRILETAVSRDEKEQSAPLVIDLSQGHDKKPSDALAKDEATVGTLDGEGTITTEISSLPDHVLLHVTPDDRRVNKLRNPLEFDDPTDNRFAFRLVASLSSPGNHWWCYLVDWKTEQVCRVNDSTAWESHVPPVQKIRMRDAIADMNDGHKIYHYGLENIRYGFYQRVRKA